MCLSELERFHNELYLVVMFQVSMRLDWSSELPLQYMYSLGFRTKCIYKLIAHKDMFFYIVAGHLYIQGKK